MRLTATFLFLVLFLPVHIFSQTDTVASFSVTYLKSVYGKRIVGDSLHFFIGSANENNLPVRINLSDLGVNGPQAPVPYQQSLADATNGTFYVTFEYTNGYDGVHKLNYAPNDGSAPFTSPVIGQYLQQDPGHYRPQFAAILGDRYYINAFYNGKHCIWSSDGTQAGTFRILESTDPITAMGVLGGQLWYFTATASQRRLFAYTPGGSPQQLSTFPLADWPEMRLLASDDNALYLFRKDANEDRSVWKIPLTPAAETLFLDSLWALGFRITGNNFLIEVNESGYEIGRYRGSLTDPTVLTRIGYTGELADLNHDYDYLLDDHYVAVHSPFVGAEIGHITANDSIDLIADLVPGPGSAIHPDGEPFLIAGDSVLYAVISGPESGNLFRIEDDVAQPLFAVDHPNHVTDLFIHGEYIYWFDIRQNDHFVLLRRKLTDTEPLVTVPAQSETWFRELALMPDSYFYSGIGMTLYNKGVFTDESEAVIAGFTLAQQSPDNFSLVSTWEDTAVAAAGRDVYARYNKYGNLLWATSLGGIGADLADDGPFTLDPSGNALVTGTFGYKGVLAGDTIVIPWGSSCSYAAKLDRETGAVLWSTILGTTQLIEIDAVTSDDKGNAYVAFKYWNFSTNVGGYHLSAEVSPANALLKIDPDGNVLWANNMTTPWMDYYGVTRVLRFDPEVRRILAVQSQGYYDTWSSCDYTDWDTYIQTIDTNGTVLNAYNYTAGDIGGITTGEVVSGSRYFLSGYFRGELNVGGFSTVSDQTESCWADEGYRLLFDASTQKPSGLSRTDEHTFYPVSSVRANGFVYVIGTNKSDRLFLLKYEEGGTYVGYLPLNQYADVFSFYTRHNYIAATDSHIVVLGNQFYNDTTYGVVTTLFNADPLALLKIRNEGWIADTWFGEVEMPYFWENDDTDFIVYPNNFEDDLFVHFRYADHGYQRYMLYDLNGKLLDSGGLTQEKIQVLHFGDTGRGLLLLKLIGNDEQTVKVVHAF